MSLQAIYEQLGAAGRLTEERGNQIVATAKPLSLDALGRAGETPGSLPVSVRMVDPADSHDGSLIPAYPRRMPDGSVVIEIVEDWGALLAVWRSLMNEPASESAAMDALVHSGERQWIGVANDVLQLFAPAAPPGIFSMITHHSLMLVTATLWLGPERAALWRRAHQYAARTYVQRLAGRPLWPAIKETEDNLWELNRDPRAKKPSSDIIDWLADDPAARAVYEAYLGGASLGIAALMEAVDYDDPSGWIRMEVLEKYRQSDYNKPQIERFVATFGRPVI